jgi:hypothetical protein
MDAVKDLSFEEINELFGRGCNTAWIGLKRIMPRDLLTYWLSVVKTRRPQCTWEM